MGEFTQIWRNTIGQNTGSNKLHFHKLVVTLELTIRITEFKIVPCNASGELSAVK